jgi:hypothetical protein
MPNAIKYNVSAETLALKKGNFYIGTGDVGKGPSDSTGYYQGPSPASGGYVVYLNKIGVPGNLSYHSAANDNQLISFTNNLSGTSFTSATQCLDYYATQTDKVCFNIDYPTIVTNGLVLNLDAGFTPSYPTTATTWYDVSLGGNNGTLVNGPTFNSANNGSIVFDGTNDYVQTPIQVLDRPCTFSTWFNFSSLTANGGYNTFFGQDTSISILRGRFYFQKAGGNIDGIQLNKINFSIVKTDGSIVPTNGLNVVQTNTWYNYTAVLTATSISLYENGVLQNTTANSDSFITPNTNIVLNAGYFSNNIVDYWPGSSSIFQIYNRALTAQEVLQNYNALKGRFGL